MSKANIDTAMVLAAGTLALFLAGGVAPPPLSIPAARAEAPAAALVPFVVETARGPVTFEVEVAATPEERRQGLQHRAELARDHGMLFDFGQPGAHQMWMKDTPIPLDMLFIGEDGRVIGIVARAEPYSLTALGVDRPTRAVVEINGGLAETLGIRPGDRVRFPPLFP